MKMEGNMSKTLRSLVIRALGLGVFLVTVTAVGLVAYEVTDKVAYPVQTEFPAGPDPATFYVAAALGAQPQPYRLIGWQAALELARHDPHKLYLPSRGARWGDGGEYAFNVLNEDNGRQTVEVAYRGSMLAVVTRYRVEGSAIVPLWYQATGWLGWIYVVMLPALFIGIWLGLKTSGRFMRALGMPAA